MVHKGKSIPNLPRLPGWLTAQETAEILQITKGRVWQMMTAGKFGQAFRIGPHIILQKRGVEQEYERRIQMPRYAGLLKTRNKLDEAAESTPPELSVVLQDAARMLTDDGPDQA